MSGPRRRAGGAWDSGPTVLAIESDVQLPPEAGGKASGLRRLIRFGLSVPPSWVVLPGASHRDLRGLAAEWEARGVNLLAVRSSDVDEDRRGQSFAGVHETLLGVPPGELEEAVRRVARSALSERARAYRRMLALEPPLGPCAVVVQPLVAAEAAGVAFGRWNGRREIVVEAAAGLGETVVDGRTVPEILEVHPVGDAWRVLRRRPGRQASTLLVEGPELVEREGPARGFQGIVLTDDVAVEIAGAVAELQWNLGRPLDVEWALENGRLWWLQMRPQSRCLEAVPPPGIVWSRANLREVLPDIPSAFTRSAVLPALEAGMRASLRQVGYVVDEEVPLVSVVYGRPVLNCVVGVPAQLLGLPPSVQRRSFGGLEAPDSGPEHFRLSKALRHPLLLLKGARVSASAERHATEFIDRSAVLRAELEHVGPGPVGAAELARLLARVGAASREFTVRSAALAATLSTAQFRALFTLRRHPRSAAALSALSAPGRKTVSTRLVEGLEALGRSLADVPGIASHLERIASSGIPSWDAWTRELPPEAREGLADWLEEHGHRGPYESDIARPRYREDVRLVASLLAPLVDGDGPSGTEREGDRRRAAVEAWASVRVHCGAWATRRIRRHLEPLKRLTALRESLRSETVKLFVPLRAILLGAGAQLVREGRLEAPEDVWHLPLEDVIRGLEDRDLDLSILVERERSRQRAWRRVHVPNQFRSEDVAGLPEAGAEGGIEDRILRGDGISPGLVEGRVCVLASPEEGPRLPDGAILVAAATDPAWTPLFTRVAGVVTELGGMLSHAGIVAREFGIPSVGNVAEATFRLRDGDVIWMDGSSGRIEVRERAEALAAERDETDPAPALSPTS